MNSKLEDMLVAIGLLVCLLIALELGFRAGHRAVEESDPRAGPQVGAIQGALLGLLGLLLAFSFAAAATRFFERQDLIVAEANAIGTAYLRTDLLDEPYRSQMRAALKQYTGHRIEIAPHLRDGLTRDDLDEIDRLQSRIWSAASAGVAAKPNAMLGVLPPVNDVIDIHSTRIAAGKKHIPAIVLGLLFICSILSIAVIGYGCGTGGRRRTPLTLPLAILMGASLWITFDLDQPRSGLLQVSDDPLRALHFDAPPQQSPH